MEDNIFDKIFEEKLNTPQHYTFNEAAWLDVEQQLQPDSRRRRFWWIMAASIAIPVLMMTAYFYTELASATSEIATLKKKMDTLQTQQAKITTPNTTQILDINQATASKQGVSIDEVSNTSNKASNSRFLNKNTTLHSTKSLARSSKNSSKRKSNKSNKNNTIVLNAELEKSISNELNTTQTSTSDQYNEFTITTTNDINTIDKEINQFNREAKEQVATILSPKSLNSIIKNIPAQRISSLLPLELVLNNEKAGKSNPILLFKPEGYKVGISGNVAGILPQYRGRAISLGLVGEVLFSGNISMGMGIQYNNTNHLHLNWSSPDLPIQEPLEIGDQLKRIQLNTDWVQVPLYLKYVYERVDKSINPYIRVGGIMRKPIQRHYVFVFENLDESEQYKRESAPEDADSQILTMNTINAGFGIDCNLAKNINLQVETYINHDMVNKDITAHLDMIGLQTSITCSF